VWSRAGNGLRFLADQETLRLLDENSISLDDALADQGISAKQTLVPSGDSTSREPVTAIVIASTASIVALGAAVAGVIRALASRPIKVKTEVVVVGPDGTVVKTVEESVIQPTIQETRTRLNTDLPLGIKVSIEGGGAS
jgi:hypothetical protein